MKILVIGGGGREHALSWKLANDSRKPDIYCAPGNAGTAKVGTNVPIAVEDIEGLIAWSKENHPDLVVVGPEVPLCAGLTDKMEAEGFRVFGPNKAAAQMEGSKIFAKEIMEAGGVPTAKSCSFTDASKALAYVRKQHYPLVLKAEGLAAGKGVIICESLDDAEKAVNEILVDRVFGESGSRLLVEEFLHGEEASILALIDGEHIVMLASSQDHKRVFNNDVGPNTGGMGAYSPAPVVTDKLWPIIKEQVFSRTLKALKDRGIKYKGVLYAGLMISDDKINVLEFNCRFGDPETQAILPRIDGDLIPALEACIDGTLDASLVKWRDEACVSVVMASGGYPGAYEKGKVIEGLDSVCEMKDVVVFHAGTSITDDNKVVTSGGRVLGITAFSGALNDSIRQAYHAILKIKFDQAQYRTDIGAKALRKIKEESVLSGE